MLNQVVLIGRLVGLPSKDGDYTTITIKVPRSEKDQDGNYSSDYIKVSLSGKLAENTQKYCKENDILGIKGKIAANELEMKIVADKVTFLSNNNQ